MKFYITPDKRFECEKKLDRMFKHFTKQPEITYSDVRKEKKETVINYGSQYGIGKERTYIDVIEVTVEDICAGEWRLVAEVRYREDLLIMCDATYFKEMPKQYGLEYSICDYCGGKHKGRVTSYVLRNNVTGEWKQVGSSCVNKAINGGKYLANITTKLFEYFRVCLDGCEESEFGSWQPADHYWQKALSLDFALTLCKKWIDENGTSWVKPVWENGRKTKEGTNDALMTWTWDYKDLETDGDFAKRVVEHWNGISDTSDFTVKIKRTIDAEFVAAGEMYIPFFAVKSYLESLTRGDWDKALQENNITEGSKYTFHGTLVKCETRQYVDYYCGDVTFVEVVILRDNKSGLTFTKTVSHSGVIDPYKQADGTYRFNASIKRVDERKREVKLGGRLSKAKAC